MLTARHAAIRLLKLMMVASLVLPAVLFGFAAWFSYRSVEHVTDERIYRSLMGSIGPYFFAMSQRLPSADGQFAGIVTVALLPDYFEKFYGRMATNDGSYFALTRADGDFLARFPVPTDRSAKLDTRSLF